MSSERKTTLRLLLTVSRLAAVVAFSFLSAPVSSQSENQVTEETRNRKVEPPEVTEENRVKLDVKDVPWFHSWEDRGPVRSEQDDPDEHRAYCFTVVHARQVPLDLLAKHSIKVVPLRNLVEEKPRKMYRFQPIRFEGRLVRIDRIPAVPRLVKDSLPEAKELYEAWLFPKDDPNYQPICVIFSELPEGVKPANRTDYWVAIDGYYFKLMEYRSNEKNDKGNNVWRMTPLLIGHAPRLVPAPDYGGFTFGGTLVPILVGTILTIGAVAFGLTYWFRKGDRAVRERIDAPKANPFQDEDDQVRPGAGWGDHGKKD